MHGKLWAHISGKLSSSLQHPETTLAALRSAHWPASLSWVDKHRGDLRMDLFLISFTPTPFKTPCICPVSRSAPPLHRHLIKPYYVIDRIQQLSCALLPVVRQRGRERWAFGLMAALAPCFCETAGQLFRFKTINKLVCPKTVAGWLDEQQNDKFPGASSVKKLNFKNTLCWYLHAWNPQELTTVCSVRLLSSDDNSSFWFVSFSYSCIGLMNVFDTIAFPQEWLISVVFFARLRFPKCYKLSLTVTASCCRRICAHETRSRLFHLLNTRWQHWSKKSQYTVVRKGHNG